MKLKIEAVFGISSIATIILFIILFKTNIYFLNWILFALLFISLMIDISCAFELKDKTKKPSTKKY